MSKTCTIILNENSILPPEGTNIVFVDVNNLQRVPAADSHNEVP